MTELGNFKASDARMGWSARGGQSQSAYVAGGYDNGGDPLGSSGGSAIAVSAGWLPAALGTDTAGSLIAPAGGAACYTIKPTVGLVSYSGVIPGAKSMDSVGPIAKSAYDVAFLLGCMAGYDPKDENSEPGTTLNNGKRLGIARIGAFDPEMQQWGSSTSFDRDAVIKPALDEAIAKMETLGAILYDPADFPNYAEWKEQASRDFHTMVSHEFKEDILTYLKGDEEH